MIKDNNRTLTIYNDMKFLVKHVAYESVFAANGRYESGLQDATCDSDYCNYVVTVENISKPPEVFLHCPEWHLLEVEDLENAIELAQGIVRCRVPSSITEINDMFQHDFINEFIDEGNMEEILEMILHEALDMARTDVERAWANPVIKN